MGIPRPSFYHSLLVFALLSLILTVFLIIVLSYYSIPAFSKYGLTLVSSSEWSPSETNPEASRYGLLYPLLGTITTSIIAVSIALPLSIFTVLLVNDYMPRFLSKWFSSIVESMASIPTVVYGLWGLGFLAPLLYNSVDRFIHSYLSFIPLFSCVPRAGETYLTAGVLLGIITLPYTYTVIDEAYRSVPAGIREALYSLGLTRFEVNRILIGLIKPSMLAGALLGFGRAAGETVAVALVIGSAFNSPLCLFSPGYTISSLIANNFGESFLYKYMSSVLYAGGLTLLVIGMAANLTGILILRRGRTNA